MSPRAIRDLESGRANARAQTVQLLAEALRLQGLSRALFLHAGLVGGARGAIDTDHGPALPEPVNALLGRDVEVGALVEGLDSERRRMIAVSGLPGVGKTRVAAEVAARLSIRRGWPVLWLGSGGRARSGFDPALGPLVRALETLVRSDAADVVRTCQLVGRHELLLVLDAVADVHTPLGIRELLAYCPGIRVISTSRVPWHLDGVQASVISPLPTPDPGADLPGLTAVPSVRLMLDRLSELWPGFILGPGDAAAVAEMCRRLDGLPLALEVAVGCCRVLSLRQLVEVPVPALLELTVPRRSAGDPETVGGLVGWSFERLDPACRSLLRELARSDGARTVPEVVAGLRRPLDRVLDDLGVLVGHGLLRVSHSEPAPRLHVPNLLRAFLECSTDHGARASGRSAPQPTFVGLSGFSTDTHASFVTRSTDQGEGGGMAYSATVALRAAGIIGGEMSPELEEFYNSLTKQEADVLISTRNRLSEVLPDVVAHSQDWNAPEVTQEGFDAAMLCACGLWSGSGATQK